ncbi:MAG: ParB/RepB/Spo0J family partition protein [Acidimicrobiia bacterium]
MSAATPAIEIARRLNLSERLRRRRFELLPLQGPGAPWTEVQGRGPGPSTAPANLVELISSISSVGVLQPILVEEAPNGGLRVVAGERRIRACRWGAANLGDNPHFAAIPAVVCPGPLSEEERRIWQLVENLAREDLQPGELAAALLYERSAVLLAKLLAAGVPVPEETAHLDDAVARFRALDRLRVEAEMHHVGAPWGEVLSRLGIQMREDKARQLVRAFAALPPELSTEMDAVKVALATRLEFLRLERGRADAAAQLWAAVQARRQPQLLAAAVREQLAHPELPAKEVLERAEQLRTSADEARARAQTAGAEEDDLVDGELERAALERIRDLVGELRAGKRLSRYGEGSLRLFAVEILEFVGDDACPAAVA